jgi:hypothetical protein
MSEILFFAESKKVECGCGCHRNEEGWFHCFGPCCSMPNFVAGFDPLPEAIQKTLEKQSRDEV